MKGSSAITHDQYNPEGLELFQPFDFVRLIRSAAMLVPGGSDLPWPLPAAELEKCDFAGAGLGRLVGGLNDFFQVLLGIPWLKAPAPNARVKDYALYLQGAHTRSGTLNFSSKDALGRVRLSSHSQGMLEEEANAVAFLLSGIKRVLATVPLVSPFGFVFGLALPKILRIPVLEVPASPTLSGVSLRKGDLILVFPQLLRKLGLVPPAEVTLLTASSPPLDDRWFKGAKDIGFMSLIEVYGSCPTGALGYRKGAGPYELFPHFRREGAGSLLRPTTGELFSSKRLVWRKERAFGHWTHKEGPSQ